MAVKEVLICILRGNILKFMRKLRKTNLKCRVTKKGQKNHLINNGNLKSEKTLKSLGKIGRASCRERVCRAV